MSPGSDEAPTVIRISPMAHFAPGFLVIALLTVGPAFGLPAMAALMVIPVLLSVAIERFRTVADRDTVTARMLVGSRTLPWSQIDGLKFTKSRWARACLTDGGEFLLPAVTFTTLPQLTAASGGRVPNPYRR